MNYRHAFHAGNFADVVKHVTLVAILLHLKKKEKPFRLIDTHAGRGLYDLSADEATRTEEAASGIARLRGIQSPPSALQTYLELVQSCGDSLYPGSPLIASRLLRATDRLVAIEKHPDECAALKKALFPFANARVLEADGYERLKALLPPPERRGLILIDPPYEAEDEFARAAQALIDAHRRFATGIFMLWFPIKSATQADSFCGEIANAGIEKRIRIDIARKAPPRADKERLSAAGLMIVNPPFGLAEEIRASAAPIEDALDAKIHIAR